MSIIKKITDVSVSVMILAMLYGGFIAGVVAVERKVRAWYKDQQLQKLTEYQCIKSCKELYKLKVDK